MSKQTDLINIPDAITVDGSNVGIGVSNPSDYYPNWNNLVIGNLTDFTGMTIASSPTGEGTIAFADGTSGTAEYSGWIQYGHQNAYMNFATEAVERIRIDSDGLKFHGDTAAANALNDYEEGTWTPTTNAGWTASPIDYARYTKVGDMVHVQTIFGLSGTGNTTHLEVGGLPFITRTTGYSTSPVDFGKGSIKGTYVRTESATTTVKFYYPSENTTVNRLQIRGNQVGASYVLFGLTYQTNS